MKRVYVESSQRKDELAALATENITLSNKWKRNAWIPAVIGIAITGLAELVNYYVPGFNQAVCGLVALAPATAGILITRAQSNAAKDLNIRAQKGLKKSYSRDKIIAVEDQKDFSDN